ncbi:UNVERIFIED_CONTAM: putative protein phosphatase 2C 73 [Sesamum calycinum]|uniref:PPM-type phosphatase domain-containing protein n=1 Tax=Sesamum calycinum TaxID=2727403 RepID=A0AAW2R6F4_9LAMI
MGHFSSMFNGLARSLSIRRTKNPRSNCGSFDGREAVDAMAKDAKKNDLILRTSGIVNAGGSKNLATVFSKRGEKGVNQDCCIVWEEFGCQEDMIFCGIFDGHGPWGHFVAKSVRESMPSSLLCNWQETLVETSVDPDFDLASDKKLHRFNIWKHSYLKTCAAVDQELEQHRKIDAFHSGTTALTIVRQGDIIFLANVGDSRAVLGTTSDSGNLVAPSIQPRLSKPNLPQEAERIIQCNGRVYCLHDEAGVHKILDFFPVPEVTQRHITSKDQFVVLATDGVWDVISNQEAVQIVSTTPNRAKSAKRLVESAACAWSGRERV